MMCGVCRLFPRVLWLGVAIASATYARQVAAGAAFAGVAGVSLLLSAAFPGGPDTVRAICASLQGRGVPLHRRPRAVEP
jgi:hypothetical protein